MLLPDYPVRMIIHNSMHVLAPHRAVAGRALALGRQQLSGNKNRRLPPPQQAAGFRNKVVGGSPSIGSLERVPDDASYPG
jgi:hypothetical protein